jgi:hypothetical protein
MIGSMLDFPPRDIDVRRFATCFRQNEQLWQPANDEIWIFPLYFILVLLFDNHLIERKIKVR